MNKKTLKVGDIIVCINTYSIKEGSQIFKYEINDKWKITKISSLDYELPICAIPISNEIIGYNNFSLEEMKNWEKLAEWRDKQIESIFNED